jgi:hypothetical protein
MTTRDDRPMDRRDFWTQMKLLSWRDRRSILGAPWHGRLPKEEWKADLARSYAPLGPRRTAILAGLIIVPPFLLLVLLLRADPGSESLGRALVTLPLAWAWLFDILFVLVMSFRFRHVRRRWDQMPNVPRS